MCLRKTDGDGIRGFQEHFEKYYFNDSALISESHPQPRHFLASPEFIDQSAYAKNLRYSIIAWFLLHIIHSQTGVPSNNSQQIKPEIKTENNIMELVLHQMNKKWMQ